MPARLEPQCSSRGPGDDPPEEGFLRQADQKHGDQEDHHPPDGFGDGPLRRAHNPHIEAEGQAQLHKGEHAHQHAVQKTGAPPCEHPEGPGPPQQEQGCQQGKQLA